MHYSRSIAALATTSLMAAFAAHAAKGAVYQAPPPEPEYSRFMLTGGATYLMPTMNGQAYTITDFLVDDSVSIFPVQIERHYNWGYFLAAGYMINEHFDVQASWSAFDGDNSSTTNCPDCYESLPGEGTASTDETITYQTFDGTLGQYHQLGENLMTRVFGGVRYSKITSNIENSYPAGESPFTTINDESNFSGWGPEFGFDLEYQVYNWFGIVGQFSAAFLIGDLDASTYIASSSDVIYETSYTLVIPAFDAKLGLNFDVPFMDSKDRFMIEAGYEVDYYLGAVAQLTESESIASTNSFANVAFMGPYANLSVKF